jgi:hypothetical protein
MNVWEREQFIFLFFFLILRNYFNLFTLYFAIFEISYFMNLIIQEVLFEMKSK